MTAQELDKRVAEIDKEVADILENMDRSMHHLGDTASRQQLDVLADERGDLEEMRAAAASQGPVPWAW